MILRRHAGDVDERGLSGHTTDVRGFTFRAALPGCVARGVGLGPGD